MRWIWFGIAGPLQAKRTTSKFNYECYTLCPPKNVTRLACYNYGMHDPIMIILGKNVTGTEGN